MSNPYPFPRPAPALIERFRRVRIDAVARLLGNDRIADPAIRPLSGHPHIVGPALTVEAKGPDARMAILALGAAQRGDVILITVHGTADGSCWGGGLTLSADEIGCEAIAVDGFAIDLEAIAHCRTPVYARGVTLRNAAPCPLGSLATPMSFGGMAVDPGDLVVGDADGIMILPHGDLIEILEAAEAETARVATNIEKLVGKGRTLFDLRGGADFARTLGFDWPV